MLKRPIILVVAGVLSLGIYSRAFDNGFREDDFVFVEHSASQDSIASLLAPSERFAFYRPGALVLFAAEFEAFGFAAGRYIGMNYVVFLGTAALLVGLAVSLGFRREVGVLAGSVFLLGASHYGKQVMWASAGGPLVSVLLVVTALVLAARSGGGGESPRRRDAAGGLAALLLAPAFHESGLIGPFLAAGLMWLRAGSSRPPRRAASLLLPVAIWAVVYATVGRAYAAYGESVGHLLEAPVYLVRYLGFMLVPVQRSAVLGPALGEAVLQAASVVRPVASLAGLAGLAAAFWLGGARVRFLVAWLLLALAPFCLVPLPDGWLELRYTYAASLPAAVLLSAGVLRVRRRPWRTLAAAAIAGFALASVALTLVLENKYDRESRLPVNTQRLKAIAPTSRDRP